MRGIGGAIALISSLVMAAVPHPVHPDSASSELSASPEAVDSAFAPLREAVVKLVVQTEIPFALRPYGDGYSVVEGMTPVRSFGSGLILSPFIVNGRKEYWVLTNHHVAAPAGYARVENGRVVARQNDSTALAYAPTKRSMITPAGDTIALALVYANVPGDMALMRTVGAPDSLPHFPGGIGQLPLETLNDKDIISAGYPYGGEMQVHRGLIQRVHDHRGNVPHVDLVVDIPVAHGQSGSPLFVVEPTRSGIEFRLVGLVHAIDDESQYATSYTSWERSLPHSLARR